MKNSKQIEIEWHYRVAQNPRWFWLPIALPVSLLGVLMLIDFVTSPGGEASSRLFGATCIIFLGFISVRAGGFKQFRPEAPHPPSAAIPTAPLWQFHIPMFITLFSMGTFSLIEYLEPQITFGSRLTPTHNLITAIAMYATIVGALIARGHRREMRFTPTTLEYARGWFSASLPWDEIVALTPVCDANLKNGGIGDLHKSTIFNFRPGVHLTVGTGVTIKGPGKSRAMTHRIDGRDVVHVDCSEYRIDANTLINAIYLLTHNPALRTQLDHPSGAEIFAAPSWNTRRAMRVGDAWDRSTNEIIPPSDRHIP